MDSILTVPGPIQKFFSLFPLQSHSPITVPFKRPVQKPTLWIAPPRTFETSDFLSTDVECLKWQAYIALRGLTNVAVRSDVSPEGALGERLPNLHVPAFGDVDGNLLAAHMIPGWVDEQLGVPVDDLEGYKDGPCKDESRAWVSLLEGVVHTALITSLPLPSLFSSLMEADSGAIRPVQALMNPPPAPLTGISSFIPPYGVRMTFASIQGRYTEAIGALSERLGTDKWFLGSDNATALDALAFAYLHVLMHGSDDVRIEVTKRVNLVTWERRVRSQVQGAFCSV
ncbi:hypothetical protein CONPUDRAFT_47817 [Coniophora puteana RWD-64-598 SS2]|uniref:Metaxin glutathione S-transferase domain-containing protein n=1 Tax=Coniophora puteana (strain RWD-64-598) TaxID=741705 RepID=A0A5M3N209_CONPW|nr:uncharacterized protein CONPUDRAFT_47817 [Coniophora puteana RWD-64-598 SS2]EIW84921.1 hypothetical protein CONPUDRAFT_47817 [Coniophora puteana RWD-64-598 SS2]